MREGALRFVQKVECPDHLSLPAHGDRQLRQHVAQPSTVPGFLPDVVHQDGTPFLDGSPDDTFSDLQPAGGRNALRIPDRVRDLEFLSNVVEQIHRERTERGQPRDQLRNFRQELIEIENGRDLAPQFEQGGEQLRVRDGTYVGLCDGRIILNRCRPTR